MQRFRAKEDSVLFLNMWVGGKISTAYSVVDCLVLLKQEGHAAGGAVVEALRYKPEGRGIDSQMCHWNFSLT
jgi:hypothetical protein